MLLSKQPSKCKHYERVYRELIEEEWDDIREELTIRMDMIICGE